MKSIIHLSIALAALAFATPVWAFNPQPEPPGSVMTGIAYGQTARVSVVNSPSRNEDVATCTATLKLLSSSGWVLRQQQVTLSPGASTHLDLRSDELRIRLGTRVPIRATVSLDGGGGACTASARSALELFETSSGRTNSVFIVDDNMHRLLEDAVEIVDDNMRDALDERLR